MAARIVICRSNPVAPDPRVEKTARALLALGYTVQIVGWDRTGKLPEIDRLSTPQGEILLCRLPIKGEFGHGLGNLPGLLRWQWSLLKWLVHHRGEYDLIHACDFDTVLPALACKWLWAKKLVYDIYDFYADHLRATPRLIKKTIRQVDLKTIGWVDAVILVDDSRRAQIAGSRPRRLAVIYNSPEEDGLPEPTPGKPIRSGGLRLAYIGLLQVERGLLEMLEVLGRHPEWELDLAGFGGDEPKIAGIASGMPNVRWHGRISYDKALRMSFEADVLFATYDPSIPNHRFSSPNKVFEAMLLGKPVIVARHTNMDRIIEQAECGLVVDYGNLDQLEAALQALANDAALRLRLGENGRRAYETEFSWEIMQTRLAQLYAAVAGPLVP